jgi:hypothetical protein
MVLDVTYEIENKIEPVGNNAEAERGDKAEEKEEERKEESVSTVGKVYCVLPSDQQNEISTLSSKNTDLMTKSQVVK